MSDDDPLDLAGQRKRKAEKAERELLIQANKDADVKWLMSRPRGRRIVWRDLESAGVFRLSYDPTSDRNTCFAEGNRNNGQRTLAAILRVCPELFPVMLTENQDARSAQPAGRRASRTRPDDASSDAAGE